MLLSPYLHTSQIDRNCKGFKKDPCNDKPTTHTVVMIETQDDGANIVTVNYFCEDHAQAANARFMPRVEA